LNLGNKSTSFPFELCNHRLRWESSLFSEFSSSILTRLKNRSVCFLPDCVPGICICKSPTHRGELCSHGCCRTLPISLPVQLDAHSGWSLILSLNPCCLPINMGGVTLASDMLYAEMKVIPHSHYLGSKCRKISINSATSVSMISVNKIREIW
jgi:hypothetical protein